MEEYLVRRRRVNMYGGGCTLLFIFIIFPLFIFNPLLWWLWLFILIPPFGYGYGRVYYVRRPVETYEPIREPRSPRAGRDTPEGIEMKELKF